MSVPRLSLLVVALIAASGLVVFFFRRLLSTLQTGVTATIHRTERRAKPTEYWLFVAWNILLIVVLLGFILLGALVATGLLDR